MTKTIKGKSCQCPERWCEHTKSCPCGICKGFYEAGLKETAIKEDILPDGNNPKSVVCQNCGKEYGFCKCHNQYQPLNK